MDRKEFLSLMGLGAAGVIVPACMGCSKDSSTGGTTATTGVNENLDLTLADNQVLNVDGGYKIISSVNVLVFYKNGTYYAVQSVCPHESGTLIFTNGKVNCTKHTNSFSNTGVSDGQTTSASLKTYTCTKSGNILNVKG